MLTSSTAFPFVRCCVKQLTLGCCHYRTHRLSVYLYVWSLVLSCLLFVVLSTLGQCLFVISRLHHVTITSPDDIISTDTQHHQTTSHHHHITRRDVSWSVWPVWVPGTIVIEQAQSVSWLYCIKGVPEPGLVWFRQVQLFRFLVLCIISFSLLHLAQFVCNTLPSNWLEWHLFVLMCHYGYVMWSGDIMWSHMIRPHHITRRRHITRAHQMTIT